MTRWKYSARIVQTCGITTGSQMASKLDKARNDLTWWILTRSLRHIATGKFADNVMVRLSLKKEDKEPIFYPAGTVLRHNC